MFNPGSRPKPDLDLEAAREGVTGLIQLGAAWGSIDTFRALQLCLHSQQAASVAHLAYLRQKELADAGATSLHPDEGIREAMEPFGNPGTFHGREQVERFYHEARAAAKERERAWLAYQEERFVKGMHPDTHPEFWNAWEEHEMPSMPNLTVAHLIRRNPALALGILVLTLVLAGVALLVAFRKLGIYLRSRRPARC